MDGHKTGLSGWTLALAAVLILLGSALRLTDLTDPPLDFNPTRQLRSAIIARATFYTSLPDADPALRKIAITNREIMERLEPPMIEWLAAAIYPITGETIAVPRAINTLIWLVGGGVLFLWGTEAAGAAGGLTALAYFLFLPFSVYGSRSFQPDPGMVVCLVLTGYSLQRWNRTGTWKWAVLSGLIGGIAILIKVPAIFFAGGMAIGVLSGRSRAELARLLRQPQVYVMAVAMLLPVGLYYLLGAGGETGSYIANRTLIALWRDVLTPSFYMRWLIRVDGLLLLPFVLLAFTGALVARMEQRWILLGLWAGYVAYGLFFPHHIVTHDYYHLPLVFLVSISLAPLGGRLWAWLGQQGRAARLAFAGAAAIALLYPAWIARSVLIGQDFRDAPAYWELVGQEVPDNGRVVGYSQDYGFRLMYYGWQPVQVLPEKLSPDEFRSAYAGADYFVITAKNQLSDDLAGYLEATYPVLAEGGGYVVYELKP